jgi:hypothetical protein
LQDQERSAHAGLAADSTSRPASPTSISATVSGTP